MSDLPSASDIASRLDLKKHPRSWRGKCPACDYKGTFSVKAGRDNRLLLFCANGCDREQLDDALARRLGDGWKPTPKQNGDSQKEAATRAQKSAKAVAIFNGATSLAASDPAGRYLAHRHLPHLIASAALRFRGDCYHPEGGRYPALVAVVQDSAGAPVACHRTYLTPDGRKAGADPGKASLGPVWTGAIRLHPVAPEIVVGEGVESSASAGILLGLPAWAALSAGNLAKALILPPEVRSVVIAADRDAGGRAFAQQWALRPAGGPRDGAFASPGLTTRARDFNDILCRPHGGAAPCRVTMPASRFRRRRTGSTILPPRYSAMTRSPPPFSARHDGEMLYVPAWSSWLQWNGSQMGQG